MIHGIGTDIVAVARIQEALVRSGERFAWRILAEEERDGFRASRDPGRYLAKRFAAKEAFGKALGTGVARPATLHAVRVVHDPLGKPGFSFGGELAARMRDDGLTAFLSLSDERDFVVAFALIESA